MIAALKTMLVAYKATDIQQDCSKIVATLTVDQIEEEIDTFSPFLSLCSGIAGTSVKMRILDWCDTTCKVELEV